MIPLLGQVLVVDNDPVIRQMVWDILEPEGHAVELCASGEEALELLECRCYDLVVTDIRMREVSGMDLLAHVRRQSINSEVIIMTAYGSLETAVEALRGEAFDYLTKPFSIVALRDKVRQALERRATRPPRHAVRSYGGLSIDLDERRVWLDGREIRFTRLEFDVLAYLFDHINCVVTTQDLLRDVWKSTSTNLAAVRTCMFRLRTKLGDDLGSPCYILTYWEEGYRLGS